jgi:predicted O-linked N-acetylglucosamine transferase (SPINDLY family)
LAPAARLLEQALADQPEQFRWWRDLGIVHTQSNDWPAAAACFARSRELAPDDARSAYLYGRSLVALNRLEEAIEALEHAVRLSSELPGPHELLADIHAFAGEDHIALQHRNEVLRLRPDDPNSRAWLAISQWQGGDLEGSLENCRRVIETGVASPNLHSFYLVGLLHSASETPATIRTAHERWASQHCTPVAPNRGYLNDPDPDRPLRIGYLTGEFSTGPSFHFLAPLLRKHDSAHFELFAYYSRRLNDRFTEVYRSMFGHWRDVSRYSDQNIYEQIIADRIDILVDLSGHYPQNKLTVFAKRPAPVQVNYSNYPATTGLSSIDYVLTDSWTCPAGSENQYTEQAWNLPSGYLVYEPPEGAPALSPLPAMQNGFVTFGLFQRPTKTNARVWNAVAEIMHRSHESRLLISHTYGDLDLEESPLRDQTRKVLGERGIAPGRILFRGPRPSPEHLHVVAEADIALDTFPYNGQTTTCESLWMGVPVVTLAGAAHVSRVAAGILARAGYARWIANSESEYVQIATVVAGDLRKLSQTRVALRERLRISPVLDGRRLTHDIESAYRAMWRRWCLERREN